MKHNLNERTSWWGLFKDETYREKELIKKIDMIPTNAALCKIAFDGYNVYANSNFYEGDIIEICPTRTIEKTSLYSRDMRDIIFEVIPNEDFVIPFGYCQYYSIITNKTPEANCDYMWDPNSRTIVIRALRKILKNEILVLNIKK